MILSDLLAFISSLCEGYGGAGGVDMAARGVYPRVYFLDVVDWYLLRTVVAVDLAGTA